MNNKDFVNLLLRDIKEMSLLCESLPEMDSIPSSLLLLSKGKVESMASTIDQLLKMQGEEVQPILQEETASTDSRESDENLDKEQVVDDFEDAKEVLSGIFGKVGTELEKSVKEFIENLNIEAEQDESVSAVEETINKKTDPEPETVREESAGREEQNPSQSDALGGVQVAKAVPSEKSATKNKLIVPSATPDRRFVKTLKLCIGDRFRYKKELFNDDMELLNKTMTELDQLNSLQEAFEYIERFDWSEDNPAVEDFVQLLQSRFS